MTSMLDLNGIVLTLIIVWGFSLGIPLAEIAIPSRRSQLPARPILYLASRYVCFGSMFTIFGVAQQANLRGLISYSLYMFTMLMAVLAVVAAGFAADLLRRARL